MKLQIQITQIENGFLIGVPPQSQNDNQPVMLFCKDYPEVCAALGSMWPSASSSGITIVE